MIEKKNDKIAVYTITKATINEYGELIPKIPYKRIDNELITDIDEQYVKNYINIHSYINEVKPSDINIERGNFKHRIDYSKDLIRKAMKQNRKVIYSKAKNKTVKPLTVIMNVEVDYILK